MDAPAEVIDSNLSEGGFDETRWQGVPLGVRPSVLISPSADGYLAYELETEALFHLNPTASLVLELCDGTRDVAGLRDVLLPVVGEIGWAACGVWLHQALASGLLTGDPGSTSEGPGISASALAERAVALRADEHVVEAFICQQRATELAPDDPDMWYQLGELAYRARRHDDARAAYERYLAAHPENKEIEYILHALSGVTAPRAPDPYLEAVFGRFASFYDEHMVGALEYQAPALLFDAVSAAVGDRRPLAILDVGCGTGLVGLALHPLAHRLEGVDLSAPMLERARERGLYDVLHQEEITRFLASAAHGRFDVIAACDTFIYFGDLQQVVALAAHHLTPGGVLAFTVERAETPSFQITQSGRFAHHREYLVDVLGEAGLDVIGLTDGVLRLEYGEPVWGLVVTARRGSR
jgi:predicted TPR repeat methyltransferase